MNEIQEYYDTEKLPEKLIAFMDKVNYLNSQDYFRWDELIKDFDELNWGKTQVEYKMASSVLKSLEIAFGMVGQNNR